MSSNLRSRMRRVGAIAAFTLLAAGVLGTAPALASSACPNEQLRRESYINPTTGKPYSMGLPECRSYEMVSPLEKGASDVLPVSPPFGDGHPSFPVAADGDAVQFASQNAFGDAETAVSGFGIPEDRYVARRGASGWVTSSVLAPRGLIGHPANEFIDSSPEDLSSYADCGLTNLTNNATAGTSAVCALHEPGGPWLPTPAYSTLTGSGYKGEKGESGYETVGYAGSSGNLSDVIFEDEQPSRSAFLQGCGNVTQKGECLYEVSGLGGLSPHLSLVNVDNSGSEIPPEGGGVTLGSRSKASGSAYHAISSDGSTIYFTATTTSGVRTIYARIDNGEPDARTVNISNPGAEGASECTLCSAAPASAAYEGASADGSKAFFLTSQQLVNGDADTTRDLYEYDFNNPMGKNLVQLSAGGAGDLTPGSGAEVQGVVRTSSDGSHVYFVAKGVLTTVPNGVGEVAQAGAENLYAVDTVTGETKFVAELCLGAGLSGVIADTSCPSSPSSADSGLWGEEDAARLAQGTPDGRYLVFTTYARLITSGPEADTNEAQQVYRYDYETGKLIRISIGEPSFPASKNGNMPGMNARIAAPPMSTLGAHADINDWGRAVSEDGSTIVFSTAEQLQATDVNTGSQPGCERSGDTGCDVYVWHEGAVSMVSDGHTVTSEGIDFGAAGMSASGSDIFFFTRTPLVGQDSDQLVDVYDARINGGFPAPTLESSCSGEACQGAATTPPSFGNSGSSSFTGGGNVTPGSTAFPPPEEPKAKPLTRAQKLAKALKQCKKDKAKAKRKSCEKEARKKYGPVKKKARKK
jgi:hypothetical protein